MPADEPNSKRGTVGDNPSYLMWIHISCGSSTSCGSILRAGMDFRGFVAVLLYAVELVDECCCFCIFLFCTEVNALNALIN